MNRKKIELDDETRNVLKQGKIQGKVYYLPDVKLERELYEKVNKALVAMGANWNKKEQGHVFDYDIADSLKEAIDIGTAMNWKKSTDFFFTPVAVVNEMLGHVPFSNKKFKMLEPEAGQGHILDIFKENFPKAEITCVEINPNHCERLREKGYNPIQGDFLQVQINKKFDLILMNPPFSDEMEHIQHAYSLLKEDGGQLISIASNMILDRDTKKGRAFKEWFDNMSGYSYELPTNSFKESGTRVLTKILIFKKD